MKRLIFLLACVCAFMLYSCSAPQAPDTESNEAPNPEEIIVPPFSDIGREKISFSDIEYVRPDTEALLGELSELIAFASEGNPDYDTLVDKILSVDGKYAAFDTMASLLLIKTSSDINNTELSDEYELITSSSPEISRRIEELFVILANSEHASRLEDELFDEGFIDKYKDGTKYNDYNVSLLERESELEAEYLALSPATVMISFEGTLDTYENTVERVKEKYKINPIKRMQALAECEELYNEKLADESCDIFIKLLKLRYSIAEAFGYESYREYSYEALGHDYSPDKLDKILEDISEYSVPVYASLNERAFAGYFKTNSPISVDKGKTVNTVFSVMERLDSDFAAAYSYMLNCGLYDIDTAKDERRQVSFTTYLYDCDAPFIFGTFYGRADDYMTLSHEFGHFYDGIKNDGEISSLDVSEISSTAMELLSLTGFKELLSADEYKYLYYSEMKNALEVLIFQGFYAKFEALAYSLPYEEITRERLDGLVKEAAAFMKLNTEYINSLSDVLIIHLIDTPFYVQSYCTSLLVSLDIFFAECNNKGDGTAAYKRLLAREGSAELEDLLAVAGLSSPFEDNAIPALLDKIYLSIIGSHFYDGSADIVNAA